MLGRTCAGAIAGGMLALIVFWPETVSSPDATAAAPMAAGPAAASMRDQSGAGAVDMAKSAYVDRAASPALQALRDPFGARDWAAGHGQVIESGRLLPDHDGATSPPATTAATARVPARRAQAAPAVVVHGNDPAHGSTAPSDEPSD